MLAQAPDAGSSELDALLGECDARSYAPKGRERTLDADLLDRAAALATAIARSVE